MLLKQFRNMLLNFIKNMNIDNNHNDRGDSAVITPLSQSFPAIPIRPIDVLNLQVNDLYILFNHFKESFVSISEKFVHENSSLFNKDRRIIDFVVHLYNEGLLKKIEILIIQLIFRLTLSHV